MSQRGTGLPENVRAALRRVLEGTPASPLPEPAPTYQNGTATGLYGYIDVPATGDVIQGISLVARGWHMFGTRPALAVAATIDGRVVGRALVGNQPRPDVADQLGNPDAELSGWSIPVELPEHKLGGSVTLQVAVWAAVDHPPVLLAPVTVTVAEGEEVAVATEAEEPPFMRGHIDLPAEDSELERGVILVAGWAYTPAGPVDRVEIALDGRSCGHARIGLPREDLVGPTFAPHARLSGFELVVDLTKLGDDRSVARLTAVAARATDGPIHIAERLVRFAPSNKGEIAIPSNRSEPTPRRVGFSSPDEGNASLDLVCFTHDLGYGGGQLWLSELLDKAGAGREFPCTVVAPRSGPLQEALERMDIEVHVTENYPLTDAGGYEGRVTEFSAWLSGRNHNAALVNTFGAFFGADVSIRNGIPTVWGIHESWEPEHAFWYAAYPPGYVHPLVRERALWALRNADAVVFEAEATRRLYAPYSAENRAIKVPYGIDTGSIEQYARETSREMARHALGIDESRRVILVMGTIEPRKSQTLIAEAFSAVGPEHPDALLAFVGDTGSPYSAALKQYVDDVGISKTVWVIPVVPDTYRWYRAADILLCASDVESLPRSVLEAMCFGVPVAATAVFGLSELIADKETGFLFPAGDRAALSEMIRHLLEVPRSDLVTIGEAGRRDVLERHDSVGYARTLSRILRELADGQMTGLPLP